MRGEGNASCPSLARNSRSRISLSKRLPGSGNVVDVAVNAFKAYAEDVRSGSFPDDDHSYKMKPEEAEKLKQALAKS